MIGYVVYIQVADGAPVQFYQPFEGGWRHVLNGPYRNGKDGETLTFPTLDAAAEHVWTVQHVRE